jgi:hypothetical protein
VGYSCLANGGQTGLAGHLPRTGFTVFGVDGRCSIPGVDKRFFSALERSNRLWGPLSFSFLSNGSRRALSLGVQRLGREADHSPPSSAKVKNGEAIPPLPLRLHGVVLNYLIKQRDNFTLVVTADIADYIWRTVLGRI